MTTETSTTVETKPLTTAEALRLAKANVKALQEKRKAEIELKKSTKALTKEQKAQARAEKKAAAEAKAQVRLEKALARVKALQEKARARAAKEAAKNATPEQLAAAGAAVGVPQRRPIVVTGLPTTETV